MLSNSRHIRLLFNAPSLPFICPCKIRAEGELVSYFEIHEPVKPLALQDKLFVQLSKQFSNFFNAYSKAYNKRFERKGALFLNQFKRKEVTDDRYYTRLIYYIHQNPVKHGFSRKISSWPYSSFRLLISEKTTLLCRNEVLDWFGGREIFIDFHERAAE
ncbi:hypothetical protein [Larkinella terrae]|uniref:hypothetical protein n=1 Tax=Larkinella terrae TaxID=2025311 RepID=UPI001E3327DA|nr:hypothetical protein [Larkinella terrae]